MVRSLVVFTATLMLAGCTAAMMGGGGAGGYPPGKDQREAAVVASDSAITTKIKAKYAADSVVSIFSIGVRTYKGSVTLTGTVGSFRARNQAEMIASGTNGVRAVKNLIVVEDRSVAE